MTVPIDFQGSGWRSPLPFQYRIAQGFQDVPSYLRIEKDGFLRRFLSEDSGLDRKDLSKVITKDSCHSNFINSIGQVGFCPMKGIQRVMNIPSYHGCVLSKQSSASTILAIYSTRISYKVGATYGSLLGRVLEEDG